MDSQRLTRYALIDGKLQPRADGAFVSYAALLELISRDEEERQALSFLRSAPAPPSYRARFVRWLKDRL